jgi:glycine cleavage system transcriptional repressor
MTTYLVVTITCPDRPGIVERLTEVLVGYSANWEESRLARLGGDFAGIVKISVLTEQAEALVLALRQLADEQMSVTVKVTQLESPGALAGGLLCDLRLVGADHEGIVHSVAAYLARQGINVESLETEIVPAPITATPLFHMQARIMLPPGRSLTELRTNLERIGEELGVDIEVQPCPR